MAFVVAIVGRPNVGKSRLFNRLTREGDAIVHDEPGVTRDRQYGQARYGESSYTVVDTGGLTPDSDGDLLSRMHDQAELAMQEADAIIFVMDARRGITPADREIADMLRSAETPVVFAVNKVDPGTNPHEFIAEFYSLGVDLMPISAEHGDGVGDLVEVVLENRELEDEREEEPPYARCAVVGRPNVGKSTLVNRLLGVERVLTSETPGTTRDAIDTHLEHDGTEYQLIDTAGLRRKSRIDDESLERLSVVRAIKSIDRADVAILVLEAPEGVTRQDKKIADVVKSRGRACVVAVNKWDLLDKHPDTGDLYRSYLDRELGFLDWAPVFFISAKTGRKTDRLFSAVDTAFDSYTRRIDTSPLNDFLEEAVGRHTPPSHQGRQVKFYYGTQVSTRPPTFVFFVNYPDAISEGYERYLENRLREAYNFEGTPVRIHIRERD